ncbi:MAG: DUF2917 domain-containing protein [Bdellovibrionales bacterium]|nr:DUF2917 domain-containing protein [Bdellovibrionales bacterium]
MIYQIKLQKGELWRPKELKRGSYKVLSGMAWVTYTGVPDDYVVNLGETLPATHNGMVVEALEDLTLEVQTIEFKLESYEL